MPAPTVQDLILYRALRLAQITRGPKRIASPEQLQDALGALNDLVDSLNIQPDAIFSYDSYQYRLSPPKQVYTIGQDPAGVLIADFNAPRPIRIDQAKLVLAGPTPIYLTVKIATPSEWSALAVRNVRSTIPQYLYCDYDIPLSGLYFWPIPTQANNIELWTWQPISQFATVATQVTVPTGYAEMLVYQLAVRLSDQFGTELRPNVLAMANKLLGRVKAHNSSSPSIPSADWGTSNAQGGHFNYLTGQPG